VLTVTSGLDANAAERVLGAIFFADSKLPDDPRDANDARGLSDPLSLARAVTRGALVEIELLGVPIFDGFDPEATELVLDLAQGLVDASRSFQRSSFLYAWRTQRTVPGCGRFWRSSCFAATSMRYSSSARSLARR